MNPSGSIIQIVDTEALSRTTAQILFRHIKDSLEEKETYTLVLSGGSTPQNTFTLLASDETFRFKIPWERIHFFWGDERHVPPDDAESNYRMANKALLSKIPVPGKNIHRIKLENPEAGNAAAQYEEELCKFFKLKRGQLPRFDCVLLGMGSDGHTASLFPGTEALHEKERFVVANWVERFQHYRITLTLPVLNNADFVIFLVSGIEKSDMLKEVIERKGHTKRLPAQLIKPIHGRLLWLIDRAAASRLNH